MSAPVDSEIPPDPKSQGVSEPGHHGTQLGLLSLLHLSNDAYSNFLGQLQPLLVERFHLTLAAAGGLASVSSVAASLTQPFFGKLADRLQRPWFVILGPLAAAVFMSCLPLAPGRGWLMALLALGGLGSAVFHPQSASWAARWSGRKRGRDMALFISGGSIGFSLGPVFVATALRVLGAGRIYWMALPGVLLILIVSVPFLKSRRPTRIAEEKAPASLRGVARPLVLLFFLVVIRSLSNQSLSIFLPLLLARRTHQPMAGALPLTCFLLTGALGGLAGGPLADRFGRRNVILGSMLFASPFLFGFLHTSGWISWGLLLMGGLVLQLSLPVNVVFAQELLPAQMSTVSGLMMGFAWGVAGLLLAALGWFADRFGLVAMLSGVAFAPAVGAALAWALPRDARSFPGSARAG